MNIFIFIKIVITATLGMLVFSYTAEAQDNTGILAGKVTDSSTNFNMAGVSITVKGSSTGVASINNGTYILKLAPGRYIIIYSYNGYTTREISEIDIKSGQTTFMDIFLSPSSKLLTGVVISASARREAQATLYNRQRLSSAVSDGISQEMISRTPDNNAGQILKRVTGVSVQNDKFVVVRGLSAQYNQTMLNGVAMTSTETNQNAFSFDLIPAAAIDNIVVNKTATPDMPGNFAGGVVQINTKDFPTKDFFSVTLQTGFSDQTHGKDFYSDKRTGAQWLGFGGKSQNLPASFPKSGDRINLTRLNMSEITRQLQLLENNLAPINHGPSGHDLGDLNENIQLGYGKTIKIKESNQLGVVVAITQRKSELIQKETIIRTPIGFGLGNTPQFLNFSENTRYLYSSEFAGVLNFAYSFGANKLTLKSLYTNVFRKNFIKRDSVFNPAIFDFPELGISGFAYRTEQRGLINSILAGEHKTGRNKETQLDWNINVSTNNINLPDTRNFLLSINEKGNYSFINRGIGLEQSLATSSRVWTESRDLITGGAFNLSSVFNLFNVKQVVKGGILFQTRRRVSTGTGLVLDGIINFPLDSILAPSAYLRGVTIGNVGNALESSGNYNANTSLQAVYESIENRIGKYTRVIWGVRFENYKQSVNVFNLSFDPNFITPEYVPGVFASRTALDFLPSVNIIYSPLNTINFRGAFSQTVIRPDLQDIAQYTRYDFQTFQLTGGNVNIKSTNISNYDLKFEWFPSAGEIFSLGAFYKEMENPIEYAQTTQENVLAGNIAINSGNAVVRGLEAEFRKRLNFISFAKWMENVTLFGNAALIRSRVAATAVDAPFVDFSPEHRLSGQPDYILNGGISIAAFKKSFEATLSFNRTGDYVDDLGSSNFVPDPWRGKPLLNVPNFVIQGRDVVDLSVRQSLLKGKGLFKFNVSNLLSKPLIIYQNFDGNDQLDNPFETSYNPVSSQFLVVSGDDNIASTTNGQRTFSLSFTYVF